MKKQRRKFILMVVIMIGLLLTSFQATAETTIGEITILQTNPQPGSTITISVNVSGETPSQVNVFVEECSNKTGICFSDTQNVTMPNIGSDTYQVNVRLRHEEATNFTCRVFATTSSGIIHSAIKTVLMYKEPTDGNQSDHNGTDGKKTPGFEMILFSIAVGLSLIIVLRKRFR